MGEIVTTYQLFKSKVFFEEVGWCYTYGICDRRKTVIVDDITTDLAIALKILVTLNTFNVSTVHLKDVIEDMLE